MNYFLRELNRDDVPIINQWRNKAGLIERLGSVFRYIGIEVDQEWFSQYLISRNTNIRLGICDLENQTLIGAIYLLNIDWVSRHGELSIWIGEDVCQGKGAGRFAMTQLLRHAFQDLNLHRVWLRVLSDNEPAIHLYTKLGFIHEGRSRDAVFKNGKYVDLLHMSILDKEYMAIFAEETVSVPVGEMLLHRVHAG